MPFHCSLFHSHLIHLSDLPFPFALSSKDSPRVPSPCTCLRGVYVPHFLNPALNGLLFAFTCLVLSHFLCVYFFYFFFTLFFVCFVFHLHMENYVVAWILKLCALSQMHISCEVTCHVCARNSRGVNLPLVCILGLQLFSFCWSVVSSLSFVGFSSSVLFLFFNFSLKFSFLLFLLSFLLLLFLSFHFSSSLSHK